jgi:integrase
MIAPEELKAIGTRLGRDRYSEGTLRKVGKRTKQWFGYWYVYVKVDGREVRRKRKKIVGPVGTITRQEAKDILRRLIKESRGEPPSPPACATFREAWERFCALKDASWSKHTAETIRGIFKTSVLPVLGSIALREITIDPIQSVLTQMARSGRSGSALRTVRTYCKALFEYAVDVELIAKNPVPGKKLVIPRKGTPQTCERFLSLEEVHALMNAAPPREHLILRLFLIGGFRPAELFALRIEDVMPGQIRVDEAIKQAQSGADRLGDPKTEGSRADVVTTPALDGEIAKWMLTLECRTPEAWLFPSKRQAQPIRPGNYLKRTLKPLAESIGIQDLTYQALRRTCATYFRKDVKSAQAQLRHKTPLLTAKHYLKSISSDHRAAVERLDEELCPEVSGVQDV